MIQNLFSFQHLSDVVWVKSGDTSFKGFVNAYARSLYYFDGVGYLLDGKVFIPFPLRSIGDVGVGEPLAQLGFLFFYGLILILLDFEFVYFAIFILGPRRRREWVIEN